MSPRTLGQHFLVNRNIARRMVRMLNPGNHPILEIGPGMGALTELILTTYPDHPAILVELDRHLFTRSLQTFGDRCRVLNANILDVNLEDLPAAGTFSLIGNIPYYLSSDIIDWLIGQSDRIENGLFMMQKEFVEKLIPPVTPGKNSARHIMFNYRFQTEKQMEIKPGSFSPPPRVVSWLFSFRTGPPDPRIPDQRLFYRFLRTGFGSRRKTLANNLTPLVGRDRLRTVFSRIGLDFRCRAEQLDVAAFIRLFLETGDRNPLTSISGENG